VIYALAAAAWGAGPPGEVDLGAYLGVLVPSHEHELYDPFDAEFRELGPAPGFGGRLTWLLIPFVGIEGDAQVGATGVDGGGTAPLTAIGFQGLALLDDVVSERFTPFLSVGTGDLAVSGSTDGVGSDLDAAFRFGVGANVGVSARTMLRFDLRDHLSAHRDVVKVPAHNVELLIGLGHAVYGGEPRDGDGDGIYGRAELCPEQAETKNGWRDEDGCPDSLGRVKITVTDPEGHPLESAAVSVDGAPVGSTDPAGMVVLADVMPGRKVSRIDVVPDADSAIDVASLAEPFDVQEGDVSRTVSTQWKVGAVKVTTHAVNGDRLDSLVNFLGEGKTHPEVDTGADGVAFFALDPGAWQLFVSAETYGIAREKLQIAEDDRTLHLVDITLRPAVVRTTREEVVLLEDIQFDIDKATIKPESAPLLQQIANALASHPTILRVEVQGHTDSQGSNSHNQKLSQDRVDSVVSVLLEQGIEATRLGSVGYGEACPLTPNRTEADRAVNRRVQIFIVDPVPERGIPCHPGVPARRAEATTVTVPIEVPKPQ
jgi:outer membrane protein OmpA-like peptidoglycan-associated protein